MQVTVFMFFRLSLAVKWGTNWGKERLETQQPVKRATLIHQLNLETGGQF